jgi:hypothetical protein
MPASVKIDINNLLKKIKVKTNCLVGDFMSKISGQVYYNGIITNSIAKKM